MRPEVYRRRQAALYARATGVLDDAPPAAASVDGD
jgi:hypothetical protein